MRGTDQRGKPDYFEARLDLLASGGIGAVTISVLCFRLGVTKGSFYDHFASQTAFQEELLGFWEKERVEQLVPLIETMEPVERAKPLPRIGISILIATQQLEHPVDRKRLFATFDEYQRWLEAVIEDCRPAPVLNVAGGKGRSKK